MWSEPGAEPPCDRTPTLAASQAAVRSWGCGGWGGGPQSCPPHAKSRRHQDTLHGQLAGKTRICWLLSRSSPDSALWVLYQVFCLLPSSHPNIKDGCLVAQLCPTLWPHGLHPARLLWPWDFPGKKTGLRCHFLLQGIFLTQRWNLRLLHWQADCRFFTTEPPGKPLSMIGISCCFFSHLQFLKGENSPEKTQSFMLLDLRKGCSLCLEHPSSISHGRPTGPSACSSGLFPLHLGLPQASHCLPSSVLGTFTFCPNGTQLPDPCPCSGQAPSEGPTAPWPAEWRRAVSLHCHRSRQPGEPAPGAQKHKSNVSPSN